MNFKINNFKVHIKQLSNLLYDTAKAATMMKLILMKTKCNSIAIFCNLLVSDMNIYKGIDMC